MSAAQAGSGGDETTSKQLRGSSLLLVGRMLSKFVNFGVQIAIVRILSQEDFGVFAYGLALVLAGELVCKAGLGRGANRFIPLHAEKGEHGAVMGILGLVTVVILAVGMLGFGVLWAVSGLGVSGMPSGDSVRIILILAWLAPVGALDTIGIQTLACFARPREILFRKHVLGPGLRAAAVITVFLMGGDAEMLALAYLAGGLIGLVLCVHLTIRQLFRHGILPLPIREWTVPLRPLLAYSLPLISTDLVFIVLTTVTTVVLMSSHGEEGVALMRAVVPAAALIGLVVQSFQMLYLPSAVRLHARDDRAGLHDHHWRSAAWVAVLSFPLFGLMFGVAPALVPVLLGPGYEESAQLLAILAVGHYVTVCLAFNAETLQTFARIRSIVTTDVLTMLVAILCAILLCPLWGPVGAAVAVSGARIAGAFARHAVLVQTPGMEDVPTMQKTVWLKLAVASGLAMALGWVWQPPFLAQLVVLGLLSLVLLRSTAPSLDLTRSFPELLRLPLFARVVGV